VNLANNGNDDPLVAGLRALGHTVNTAAQSSGIGTIVLESLHVHRSGRRVECSCQCH
jgi:gamma-glutamyltranspeptidase / glutathione hydrolase